MPSIAQALFIDLFLLLSFAALHSALLTSAGRSLLGRFKSVAPHGTLYALSASLSIIMTVLCWRPLPGVIYAIDGAPARVIDLLYIASWLLMGRAMADTGALKQCGVAQWWDTVRRRPTLYREARGGLYRVMRHPIYAAFLGMIWFTPRMTSGHLLLAAVWSSYIVVGAVWKERRLLRRAGGYDAYCRRVPPLPLLPKAPVEDILAGLLKRPTRRVKETSA